MVGVVHMCVCVWGGGGEWMFRPWRCPGLVGMVVVVCR